MKFFESLFLFFIFFNVNAENIFLDIVFGNVLITRASEKVYVNDIFDPNFIASQQVIINTNFMTGTTQKFIYINYPKNFAITGNPSGLVKETNVSGIVILQPDSKNSESGKVSAVPYAFITTQPNSLGWQIMSPADYDKKNPIDPTLISIYNNNLYIGKQTGPNADSKGPALRAIDFKLSGRSNIGIGDNNSNYDDDPGIYYNVVLGNNSGSLINGAYNTVIGPMDLNLVRIDTYDMDWDYEQNDKWINYNIFLGFACGGMDPGTSMLGLSGFRSNKQNCVIGNVSFRSNVAARRNLVFGNRNLTTVFNNNIPFRNLLQNIFIGNNILWLRDNVLVNELQNNIFILPDAVNMRNSIDGGTEGAIFIGAWGDATRKDRSYKTYLGNVYNTDFGDLDFYDLNADSKYWSIFAGNGIPHSVFTANDDLLGWPGIMPYNDLSPSTNSGNFTEFEIENVVSQQLINLPICGVALANNFEYKSQISLFSVDALKIKEPLPGSFINIGGYCIYKDVLTKIDTVNPIVEKKLVGYESYYLIPLILKGLQMVWNKFNPVSGEILAYSINGLPLLTDKKNIDKKTNTKETIIDNCDLNINGSDYVTKDGTIYVAGNTNIGNFKKSTIIIGGTSNKNINNEIIGIPGITLAGVFNTDTTLGTPTIIIGGDVYGNSEETSVETRGNIKINTFYDSINPKEFDGWTKIGNPNNSIYLFSSEIIAPTGDSAQNKKLYIDKDNKITTNSSGNQNIYIDKNNKITTNINANSTNIVYSNINGITTQSSQSFNTTTTAPLNINVNNFDGSNPPGATIIGNSSSDVTVIGKSLNINNNIGSVSTNIATGAITGEINIGNQDCTRLNINAATIEIATNDINNGSNILKIGKNGSKIFIYGVESDGGADAYALKLTTDSPYDPLNNFKLVYSSSSKRYKKNISDLEKNIIEKFILLKPKKFGYINSNNIRYGFIAEDIYDIGLENVVYFNKDNTPENFDDRGLLAITVGMVQKIILEFNEAKNKLYQVEEKINNNALEIQNINNKINVLENKNSKEKIAIILKYILEKIKKESIKKGESIDQKIDYFLEEIENLLVN